MNERIIQIVAAHKDLVTSICNFATYLRERLDTKGEQPSPSHSYRHIYNPFAKLGHIYISCLKSTCIWLSDSIYAILGFCFVSFLLLHQLFIHL